MSSFQLGIVIYLGVLAGASIISWIVVLILRFSNDRKQDRLRVQLMMDRHNRLDDL